NGRPGTVVSPVAATTRIIITNRAHSPGVEALAFAQGEVINKLAVYGIPGRFFPVCRYIVVQVWFQFQLLQVPGLYFPVRTICPRKPRPAGVLVKVIYIKAFHGSATGGQIG